MCLSLVCLLVLAPPARALVTRVVGGCAAVPAHSVEILTHRCVVCGVWATVRAGWITLTIVRSVVQATPETLIR